MIRQTLYLLLLGIIVVVGVLTLASCQSEVGVQMAREMSSDDGEIGGDDLGDYEEFGGDFDLEKYRWNLLSVNTVSAL